MEDKIFDLPLKVDKNSREFDIKLLEEIKKLSNIPMEKFDSVMRKIMKKKSSCKLWFEYAPSKQWDGNSYRDCNYRCCPSSHRTRSYFCLLLDKKETGITVIDGFLTAV